MQQSQTINGLLQTTSRAKAVLKNCPHSVVYEEDVLIDTCDGSQRFCLICGISEIEDCYRKRDEFSSLNKPRILVRSDSFDRQRIKNVEDFLNRVKKALRESIKAKTATFIDSVNLPRKRFFFYSAWMTGEGQEKQRVFYEINGKNKGELTDDVINQVLQDIRNAAD